MNETPPANRYIVANVREKCYTGAEDETRTGTKNFAAGTKVYVLDTPIENTRHCTHVIGKHRGSRERVERIVLTRHLQNFRVVQEYSPTVNSLLKDAAFYGDLERYGIPLEEMAAGLNRIAMESITQMATEYLSGMETERGTGN